MKKCSVVLKKLCPSVVSAHLPLQEIQNVQTVCLVDFRPLKIIDHRYTPDSNWQYQVLWQNHFKKRASYESPKGMKTYFPIVVKYFQTCFGSATTDELSNLSLWISKHWKKSKDYTSLLKSCQVDKSEIFSDKINEFKKTVEVDYNTALECVALMSRPGVPDDLELRQKLRDLVHMRRLIKRREDQLSQLKERELQICLIEVQPVFLENTVNFDVLPTNFEYISKMIQSDDVQVPENLDLFCKCLNCHPKNKCCREPSSVNCYTRSGLLLRQDTNVIECNRKCRCSADCYKRVVQKGRKFPLVIFMTEKCGWGVKAMQDIPRGTFICEYIGELIRYREATIRDKNYAKKNKYFLFDLDINTMYDEREDLNNEKTLTVDATSFGNVCRFVNHGCSPNSWVSAVWVENQNPYMYRLAAFSLKDIKAGEQILFDYSGHVTNHESIALKCYCGSENCRGFLFHKKVYH